MESYSTPKRINQIFFEDRIPGKLMTIPFQAGANIF